MTAVGQSKVNIAVGSDADESFRPPSVPLIACDPYFSIWSGANELWRTETTHWTGTPHRLGAIVRIDGRSFRLMGTDPQTIAAMEQTGLEVGPTQTTYHFKTDNMRVDLAFITPALPADIDVLTRPVTYIELTATPNDQQAHDVNFYFDLGGELATNTVDQKVIGERVQFGKVSSLKLGSQTQAVLGREGDDLRIDWGYVYLTPGLGVAGESNDSAVLEFGDRETLRAAFVKTGSTSQTASVSFPASAGDVTAATSISVGKQTRQPVSAMVLLAYDDLFSIEYAQQQLRPYWRRDGWEASDLITASLDQFEDLKKRCQNFDQQMIADLTDAGGTAYANIGSLAYRQCLAAGKFVADANGQPLQFCKENHSNGCIATADVFYPMIPQFLLMGPTYVKSVLVPFMEYAESDRWKFPFAPHDLGVYPKANGQRYGGGERTEENQMQVEESGNLLILFAALAKLEGNADFAVQYWDLLSQWANYLQNEGYDLGNQLSTDDFSGHLAHNVNLSAKSILALGSYAQLCELRSMDDEAAKYRNIAQDYAKSWVTAARDGDHYKLAFDRPGTWSQKYNLVWDRLLDLNLFPPQVAQTEMKYYREIQNEYGLPLDNRSDYTKLDWILWTATLTEQREDFIALVDPVQRFLNQTPQRTPMTDWYFTSTAQKRGFDARPVVGGVFLKLLYNDEVWRRYAERSPQVDSDWAEMPVPPKMTILVANAEDAAATYQYSISKPAGDWTAVDYKSGSWKTGKGGLGTETGSATRWNSSDVWVRRTIDLETVPDRLVLKLWHDEDAEIYVNGELVLETTGFVTGYSPFEISNAAFQTGENLVAIHCHQSTGGQFIDFGIETYDTEPSR